MNRPIGLALALLGAAVGGTASSQTAPAADTLALPADVELWPVVGTTLRMDKADNKLPWQFRQVAMEPGAYAEFVRTGRYPDGAMFAARFHSVKLETGFTPPLYHEDADAGISIEVIDRGHPDGRRFYNFGPADKTATAMTAGNGCVGCHKGRGLLEGTFAQYYPLIARRLPSR